MGHSGQASFKQRRRHWRRHTAPIAAGLGALVLSISALALATALQAPAADEVVALRAEPPPVAPGARP
jgi:hypothetical protein